MKKITLSAIALVSIVVVPALAADLPARVYTKAPAVVDQVSDWTGFYVGGDVGGRWSNADWRTTSVANFGAGNNNPDPSTAAASFNSSAVRIGGYVGYNWQFASKWVAGIEGDFGWANTSNTRAGIPGTFGPAVAIFGGAPSGVPGGDTSTVRETWDAGLRGRLGYLITPNTLLYGNGGVASINVDATANCVAYPAGPWCTAGGKSQTGSATRLGWTVGAGIETKLTANWLLRGEYRYTDYGTFTNVYFAATPIDRITADIRVRTSTALIGIAYKFGGPVVAKY
jgi:outer membrane immunogenic protein